MPDDDLIPGLRGGVPQMPAMPPAAKPRSSNTRDARLLAAFTVVCYAAILCVGFLTFTYVTPRATGADSTATGWGKWGSQSEGLPLLEHAHASLIPGVLPAVILLAPAVLMSILVVCNLPGRPLASIGAFFALVATAAQVFLVFNPSDTTVTFDDHSANYIDTHYDFRAGPADHGTAVLCLLFLVCSIGTIVLSKKRTTGQEPPRAW